MSGSSSILGFVVATAVYGLLNLKLLTFFDSVSSTIASYTMLGVGLAGAAVTGLCMIEVLLSFFIFLLGIAGESSKNESASLWFFIIEILAGLLGYTSVFLVFVLAGDESSSSNKSISLCFLAFTFTLKLVFAGGLF